jgi:hypothetical protein
MGLRPKPPASFFSSLLDANAIVAPRMARRWVRIAVVVVTLAVLSVLGNQIRSADQVLDGEQAVERVFTDLSWGLTLTLADLRAAEQAYVAAGQDRVYWTTKVTSHLATVRDSLADLQRLALSPTALEALDAAESAVAELEQLDQRAREHTDLEQALLASDLIFTDGLELTERAATHIELARATERTMRNEGIQSARTTQTRLLLAGTAVGVLAMLLLVPGLGQTLGVAEVQEGAGEEGASRSADNRLLLLDVDPQRKAPTEATDEGANDRDRPETTAAPIQDDTRGTDAVPDLRVAAELCTDLSKLSDSAHLESLLARAATLINATGLILWVRDSGGKTLRPALSHGYPRQALTSMGAISHDGDNATAAAFRDARMQVVGGGDTTSGALVAPLMAGDQCVGVLSAELNDRWESSSSVQATVAIVAAQLATLVPTPDPAGTNAPPAEAHG